MKQVLILLALIASVVYSVDSARSFMTATVARHQQQVEYAINDASK